MEKMFIHQNILREGRIFSLKHFLIVFICISNFRYSSKFIC